MKKKCYILRIVISLAIISTCASQIRAQQVCPVCPNNLSFESGDFSNWTGIYGNYKFALPTPVSNPNFSYVPSGTGVPNLRYAITSGTGADPNISALPVKAPCGGNYSARIGYTGSSESQGTGNWPYFESLTYNLLVTPQTAGFTYMYAAVLVDGSHDAFTQPEFDVIMKKASDSTLLPCGQYSIYAGNGSAQFHTVGTFQYTDWTSVTTDLRDYIGQQICITFRVRDCMGNLSSTGGNYSSVGGGGHQGYAYIDAYCTPIAQFDNPEFCAGAGTLKVCAPPGYKSYSWPAGQPGLPGSPTTQCVTINNPVAGTIYTVTMMSFSGCPVTFTIPIKSIPTISSADTVHSCPGDPDTLSIKATGTNGPYTYAWSHNLGTGTSVIVKPTTTTTYTVTITNGAKCSDEKRFTVIVDPCIHELEIKGAILCARDSFLIVPKITGGTSPFTYNWLPGGFASPTIKVSPAVTTLYTLTLTDATGFILTDTATVTIKPSPVVTVNSDTICTGQTAEFTASGANTYIWPPGFIISGNTATINPTTSASYLLTGTTNGCPDTALFHVVVNTQLSIHVNSPELCAGDSVMLIASGASLYTWKPTGAGVPAIKVSPPATTTYTVIGTDPFGGCADTAVAKVTVKQLPLVSVNSPTICVGEKALLLASGAKTYTWPTGITPTGTNTASTSPPVTTSYNVIGTSDGCSDTVAFSVLVNPLPIVKVSSVTICEGDTTKLIASGATTYSWYPSKNLSSVTDSIVFADPKITTTYIITGVLNNCSDTAMATVFVNTIPNVVVNAPTICEGATAKLIASGASIYTWSPGPVVTGIGTANVAPVVTTSYTVTGFNGTCKDSAITTVTILPAPVANFNGPFEGCTPLRVDFTNASINATNYFWDFGDGNYSPLIHPIHTYYQSGSFNVTLIAKNTSCADTLTKVAVVNVYPIPEAVLTADNDVVYEGDPKVIFSDHSVNAKDDKLSFGDGTAYPLNSLNAGGIEHMYKDIKVYCATLIAQSEHGCIDTTQTCIEVKPETTFYVPNSFTLNGDSKNEFFRAYGTNIIEFKMWIFNRWGQLIFESNDLYKGWNGKYKNNESLEISQQDVYVVKIIYKDIRGKQHSYYGTATIVK